MIASIVLQDLSQRLQPDREALKKYVERAKINQPPNLTELLGALTTACETQETYLILDGPDELENPRDIAFFLEPILKSHCRVLVTSRDIPDVRSALAAAAQTEIQADRGDLATFVEGRFEESDVSDLLSRASGLVTEIIDKANGM